MRHRVLPFSLISAAILLGACACGSSDPSQGESTPSTDQPSVAESNPPVATSSKQVEASPMQNPEQPQAAESPKPFLWQVTSKKGAVSYLFGTMHLGVSLEYALPARHRALLQGAKTVSLEADITSVNPAEVAQFTMLPDDKSLKAMIKPESWTTLTNAVQQVPPQILDRMRPWTIGPLLIHLRMQEKGTQATPMDQEILTSSVATKKRMFYLETPEFQMKILNGISDECNVFMLEKTVEDINGGFKELDAMIDAYKTGDDVTLLALVRDEESAKVCPAFNKKLLSDRNNRWMKKLVTEMNKGGAFVAVGAAHLLGDDGVVELLKDRGFKVERLQ